MPARSKSKTASSSRHSLGKDKAEKQVIPVVQEEATVEHVTEKTGRAVRVRIAVDEERQRIPVTESIEEITVERIPVNRYVEERSAPREEGDVVIIPVFETVAVVEMRLLLKEEVHIVRRRREVQRDEEVVLRKERAVVEHRTAGQDEWSQDRPDQ